MKGDFEKCKSLVLEVKDTRPWCCRAGRDLIGQATTAFHYIIAAPGQVAGLVKVLRQAEAAGEANQTMAAAKSEFQTAMASASKLTDLGSATTAMQRWAAKRA